MSTTNPEDRMTVIQARERAGLPQIVAAVRLGVSEPTYRKYEQNPELMSIRTAHKLATVLGVKFDDLALYDDAEHVA